MQPDPTTLLEMTGIKRPLTGFYDTPDTAPFEPFAETKQCFFAAYRDWMHNQSVLLRKDHFTCGGAGLHLCGVETRSRDEMLTFLVETEGLMESRDLMNEWMNTNRPYRMEHDNIVIGPLRAEQYKYLKTVTFWVNPDQLSVLMIGAQYRSAPGDPAPVLAPFGSGCMQQVSLFQDLSAPQAVIGATDIAMRQYLPPDTLAFVVTKSMFERLCSLDEKSFLYKPFWRNLRKSRGEL